MMGFGIPILVEDAKALMAKGCTQEQAVAEIAGHCELRSEAIEALRNALQQSGSKP